MQLLTSQAIWLQVLLLLVVIINVIGLIFYLYEQKYTLLLTETINAVGKSTGEILYILSQKLKLNLQELKFGNKILNSPSMLNSAEAAWAIFYNNKIQHNKFKTLIVHIFYVLGFVCISSFYILFILALIKENKQLLIYAVTAFYAGIIFITIRILIFLDLSEDIVQGLIKTHIADSDDAGMYRNYYYFNVLSEMKITFFWIIRVIQFLNPTPGISIARGKN